MSGPTLGRRDLNRALLARQDLLVRADRSVDDELELLVGIQAQSPNPPYVGLWSRLNGFTTGNLADRLLDRSVVRMALMRSTIHLVTARDAKRLRPLFGQVHVRAFQSNHGRFITGVDPETVAEAGAALLAEQPMTFAELGAQLAERWPGNEANHLAMAVRTFEPLVQVPPRGLWGVGGPPAHSTAAAWIGPASGRAATRAQLTLRYLAAFGPATVADMQTWSGLTRLNEELERLRPKLRTFVDDEGRELFDLPDAPRPDPDTPAPVRLVAEFDNVVLSHADRTRIMTGADRTRMASLNGVVPATVLIDGFLAGTWRFRRRGTRKAAIEVTPWRRISKRHQAAITAEARRFLAFAAPEVDSERYEVSVADTS